MRLLSINQARSIWMFNLIDFNPRGRSLYPLVSLIVEKYNFLQAPNKYEDFDLSKGIKFSEGRFQKSQYEVIAVNLTIYSDGMVADTRSSTDDSDEFLHECLEWLSVEYGFASYTDILRNKMYVSELSVTTDKSLSAVNDKLESFSQRLTSHVAGHSHHSIEFKTAGLIFHTDFDIANPPPPFRFERAAGVPFGENRYYSLAPLQTNIHLQMLEELELIFIN